MHDVVDLLKATPNVVVDEEQALDVPEDLAHGTTV
jgi:hypothetical protein